MSHLLSNSSPTNSYDGIELMQMLQKGYKGLGLLVDVNLDRFLIPLALCVAICLGAYFGSP